MSFSSLLRMLHQSSKVKQPTHKHIVRFINRLEFQKFIKQLKKEMPSLLKDSRFQQLPTIHSMTCMLPSLPPMFNHQGIRYIEEDTRIKVHRISPIYTRSSIKANTLWNVKQINAPRAWTISTGRFVKVGVIDTGADYSHPNLKNSLARGVNFVHRGYLPWDDNGHGTHISGTIALLSSYKGVSGTTPGAVIYPVKAFDRNGAAYVSDIIQGIEWCVRNGMQLINMSFGMKQESRALHEAIANAYDQGVLLIASAGNDGIAGKIDFPARFPETIAVGATGRNRKLAKFSNRGKKVLIYAPGSKIMSTWPGDRFNTLSGTSMSTSHITGALALLLAVRPTLSHAQIRALLRKASRPLTNIRKKTMREIDAYRLLRLGTKV